MKRITTPVGIGWMPIRPIPEELPARGRGQHFQAGPALRPDEHLSEILAPQHAEEGVDDEPEAVDDRDARRDPPAPQMWDEELLELALHIGVVAHQHALQAQRFADHVGEIARRGRRLGGVVLADRPDPGDPPVVAQRCDRALPWLPKATVQAEDDGAVLSMVSSGFGMAVMPELSLTGAPANVEITDLGPERPTRSVGYVTTPELARTVAVRALIRELGALSRSARDDRPVIAVSDSRKSE